MSSRLEQQAGIARTVKKLCLVLVGMVGFVFALVPIYDLFCEVTGLNGKTGGQYTYVESEMEADLSREVRVNFITNTNQGMNWEFWPEKGAIKVNPGTIHTVNIFVRNPSSIPTVGRAIPSVAPGLAAGYFHKTECFCFEQQLLAPGEVMEMPLRFIVGPEIPGDIKEISLSYALFDVTEDSADLIESFKNSLNVAAAGR